MWTARILLIAWLIACASVLEGIAGDDGIDMLYMTVTPQTNATAVAAGQQTKEAPNGWIDTIIVDIGGGGGTPTNTVTLATAGSEDTGAARTIITLTDLAADASYPVRDLVTGQTGTDIANTPARIPLVGDSLVLSAYGANTTTNTLAVYIVIKTK